MPNPVITADAELHTLCAHLAHAPWIALDTEFMRERTYRARLCLIQVATPDCIACIDTLAPMDLSPLLDTLYRPTTVKVLHAARQDFEVLADLRGLPPQPLFDTQIAAALLGYDNQIGYGPLVEALLGHKLLKLEARTDWSRRPLSPAQLEYAEDDVRYLRDVYRVLTERLQAVGRADWFAEECAALTDPALYRTDPAEAWRRLNAGAMLAPAQQTTLVALAEWREHEAQSRDLPRGWVVPDNALVEIARRTPNSMETLAEITELKPPMVRREGEAILQLLGQARPQPEQPYWEKHDRLDGPQMDLIKKLSQVVQQRAQTAQINPTLIAPRRELTRLVRGDADCALLRGWRRRFIGEELLALCAH